MKFTVAAPLFLAALAAADSSVNHDHHGNVLVDPRHCHLRCVRHTANLALCADLTMCRCRGGWNTDWFEEAMRCVDRQACPEPPKPFNSTGLVRADMKNMCANFKNKTGKGAAHVPVNGTAPVLPVNGTAPAVPGNNTAPALPKIDNMPECALPCIGAAIAKATNCTVTDTPCLCANGKKIATAGQGCVLKKCGIKKTMRQVIPAGKAMCKVK
ncbi:hypothetical protein LLEC1_07964 [Akanthomyces lecanii]|uniref:CFEM domain-containing protein n=1 Tax=Cordyceps confragosa TaxID=2714763 RepID=A0A179IHE3_CORDF|nr:hypothetical protein LLEC1_07964 [Akanthomyces lecanii]